MSKALGAPQPYDKIADFNALRAFAGVVETQSFTATSRRLAISQSLVSKHISRLESDLKTKLLLRSTRHIVLTDAGQVFYAHCQRILSEINDAIASTCSVNVEESGHIRVFSTQGLGQSLIAPAVADFVRQNQAITIDLVLGSLMNLLEHHIDLAIRMTSETDPSLFHTSLAHKPIANMPLVPCASPDYISRHGLPRTPEDLLRHNCLLHSSKTTQSWCFKGDDGLHTIIPRGSYSSNNSSSLIDAALKGVGIGLFLRPSIANHLANGTLVSLLPERMHLSRTLTAIYPRTDQVPQKVQIFLDFICNRFANLNDLALNT